MSTLEFIASLAGALAWPLVVVALGLIFRKQVSHVLNALAHRVGSLKRLQAMGVNAEFSEEAEEVKAQVAETEEVRSAPHSGDLASSDDRTLTRLGLLAEVSPRTAVLEAFMLLEARVLHAARLTGWEPAPNMRLSFSGAMKHLDNRFRFSDSFMASAQRLRHLRNQAAHSLDFDITPGAAEDFVLSALSMAEALERITPMVDTRT